jgi:hypothetical protein
LNSKRVPLTPPREAEKENENKTENANRSRPKGAIRDFYLPSRLIRMLGFGVFQGKDKQCEDLFPCLSPPSSWTPPPSGAH